MNSRSWRYTVDDLPSLSPFGSVLADRICLTRFADGKWSTPELIPLDEFRLHPGSHCLHYGSSCFEGLKAYRWSDDSLVIFRPDTHARRMVNSARSLFLPEPSQDLFTQMVSAIVTDSAEMVPPAPGALYLRPLLLGSDTNIGAAAKASESAIFYVMASPVGNYFAAGDKALRLLIEDTVPRTTPQFGKVKSGVNYATALSSMVAAREKYEADQVLFCPQGDVQETGAANFLLIDDNTVVTKPLADSFLHGVTRDSLLTIASELGYEIQERDFTVNELLKWTEHGEAALSGTAAVLAGVGALIHEGKEYSLSGGATGANTIRLRAALNDVQQGNTDDRRGWIYKLSK